MNLTLLAPRRPGPLRAAQTVAVPVPGGEVLCRVSPAADPDATALILLPGLTGSSRSTYAVGLSRKALEAGLHVVRFEPRGCGGTEHLARPMTHVGLYEDVVEIMRHCAQVLGFRRQVVVGFSMGGNLAVRAAVLGRSAIREAVDLQGIVLVSPALDVPTCAQRIDVPGELSVYRWRFVRDLVAMLRRNRQAFGEPVQEAALRKIRSIYEFDDHYTAPVWGFDSVMDYWERTSAEPYLGQLDVPTLAIAARDDVLVPWQTMSSLRRLAGPQLRFLGTAVGGHCAFTAGRRSEQDPDRHWAENRVLEFLLACARSAASETAQRTTGPTEHELR